MSLSVGIAAIVGLLLLAVALQRRRVVQRHKALDALSTREIFRRLSADDPEEE